MRSVRERVDECEESRHLNFSTSFNPRATGFLLNDAFRLPSTDQDEALSASPVQTKMKPCRLGLGEGTSLPRGRGAGGVDKSAQLSSPRVASCLLAGACCNAISRRNTQGRAVTVCRLVRGEQQMPCPGPGPAPGPNPLLGCTYIHPLLVGRD
jgi:hypothetical protein